ncbi:hypothetical protein ACH429_06470 [Streptomyces pathocidini]|uniref:Hydrogenase expression protein HypF n=1 Tax=Streptomyces pathocidini TaxID=1650571 RepID=A0ABW7UQJ9_9ACTN|nr:hypothetical protein [Streptomyces pathocidini]
MLGDEARTGPRHAAPRKSLLTKLQIPAGKAIALAAMPTAVFVGMGLTPKLAQADEPGNPFAAGPCVTQSDQPDEDSSAKAEESAKPSESATPEPSESASAAGKDAADRAEQDKAEPDPSESAAAADKPGTEAEPSPSESTTSGGLLGGVGDTLDGLLGGGSAKEPEASTAAPEPKESSGTGSTAGDTVKGVTDAAKGVTDTAKGATDSAKQAIKDAADKAGAKVEEIGENAEDTTDALKGNVDAVVDGASGKEPFPCPVRDPAALANAKLEQGIPLLPDDPWRLESTKLTLGGLDYKGIVEVRTYSGKVKKVLKFTAERTDIKDLHQLVVGPQGTTAHVQAAKGSTSTIRDGTATMYTEELKGNLFGLIPITFSPDSPPPLNIPEVFFTDVHLTQAGQFGGTLTVPGLQSYSTK